MSVCETTVHPMAALWHLTHMEVGNVWNIIDHAIAAFVSPFHQKGCSSPHGRVYGVSTSECHGKPVCRNFSDRFMGLELTEVGVSATLLIK
jgi:hypothetical protein